MAGAYTGLRHKGVGSNTLACFVYVYVGPRLALLQMTPVSLMYPHVYFHVQMIWLKLCQFSNHGQ